MKEPSTEEHRRGFHCTYLYAYAWTDNNYNSFHTYFYNNELFSVLVAKKQIRLNCSELSVYIMEIT
jgi:hypothetical protein